jgi:hypothetical protein
MRGRMAILACLCKKQMLAYRRPRMIYGSASVHLFKYWAHFQAQVLLQDRQTETAEFDVEVGVEKDMCKCHVSMRHAVCVTAL